MTDEEAGRWAVPPAFLPFSMAPAWKLMFPSSPVAPLFVMAGRVEQGAFF